MTTKYDITIPEYISITEINDGLLIQDSRTNLASKIKEIKWLDKEHINGNLKMVLHEFDKKYNKSLPIEKRKGTNTPTDFTCPHCFTKDKPEIIKKPKIGRFSAGIWYARREYIDVDLQNVYKCTVCKNEFTQEELNNKKFEVDKTNKHQILFEQLQDKIITDKEYDDKRFELEMGMTKAEYKIKEEKEEKEYKQDTRFHFSTKNYFILLAIALVIGIILSTIYPQPNLCEKYGSDWKYDSGRKGVRSACINSNGDIKYLKTK